MNVSRRIAAGAFALALMAFGAACSSSDSDSTPSSSSATSSSAVSSAETTSTTQNAPTTHNNPAPHTTTQPANKLGQPCTDQSGAPGHYIAASDGQLVCEITGDAPQVTTTTPVRDDDPGGKPCTDQSGAPGHYIWADGQWICQITGDAPR
ncbi:hypothetical protein [Jongsikchunia kroppenstedtii]|uniref:hypothetical protein n=1 Tax=Jongsikchunia kroppenstedtii TaxID=1121721 RepID=UPI0012DDB6F6|nr:hypothetical protein [Jongsikchunia kroppenstedtii]